MTKFQMVKYSFRNYPNDIPLEIEEIAAHLDKENFFVKMPSYSLHTEYSAGARNFNSRLISQYDEIISAKSFTNIPLLWKSEKWAVQFADFLIQMIGSKKAPNVIEIHPPFDDYSDIEKFVSVYKEFEDKIVDKYPNVEILIENRCGTRYRNGKFILSSIDEVRTMCFEIYRHELKLRLAYDIPQIYTAHNAVGDKYISLLEETKDFRQFISGVHLWGRKDKPHFGDLSAYFGDENLKSSFLHAFRECFNDDISRKLVLEVNSNDADLHSIINDLNKVDITYI